MIEGVWQSKGKFVDDEGNRATEPGDRVVFEDEERFEAFRLNNMVLPVDGGEEDEKPLDELSKDELKARADDQGIDVEGTGADGRVLKSDLLEALKQVDE